MAFDRPLEADRVDNLNIFSSFVRGPIMWAIGGLLSDDKENATNKETIEEDLIVSGIPSSDCTSTTEENHPSCGISKKAVLEESSNTGTGLLRRNSATFRTQTRTRSKSLSHDEHTNSADLQLKKSRKMSWSDESGQNLVHYFDEVSHDALKNYS
jgi:hypothetical protein